MKTTLTLVALLALHVLPLRGQGTKVCETDFPCLSGYAGYVVHDVGHTVTAVAVAEGVRLLAPDMKASDRYLLGTVALPIVQELFDYTVFHLLAGTGFQYPPSSDSLTDILTYQGAWIVPLIQERKYWQAALVTVAWGGYVSLRAAEKNRN